MKRKVDILLVIALLMCSQACCQSSATVLSPAAVEIVSENDFGGFKFQNGDLLFQDLECGELCDAIERVTHGVNGKSFSHIGLVYIDGNSRFVIEAIGKDVHLTDLNEFMSRSRDRNGNPKIVVGRLKKKFLKLNEEAVKFALAKIGTPYDDQFIYDNGKYYCSELIYDAYKKANDGKPLFELQPMTFKDPSTGQTFPAWTNYYMELNSPIPEGKPGCNPGSISTSDRLEIVRTFY